VPGQAWMCGTVGRGESTDYTDYADVVGGRISSVIVRISIPFGEPPFPSSSPRPAGSRGRDPTGNAVHKQRARPRP